MSDPVEDGVRLLQAAQLSGLTWDEMRVVVRNIIAPAVQAERERIRTAVTALDPAPYVEGYDDPDVPLVRVLGVIDDR